MKIIIFLISFLILGGCATYVEEANNQQFKPLRPSFEEFEKAEPSNGSIYSTCLLYTSPSPRDAHESRMPSSA